MFVLKQVLKTHNLKHIKLPKFYRHDFFYNNSASADFLKLEASGETLKFPFVWLRDNCQCDKCFHQSAKSRILDWSSFNVDVQPKGFTSDQSTLTVTWDDDHTSQYNINWLKLRSFAPEHQKNYKETIYKPPKVTWSGDQFHDICSQHQYDEILKSDQSLYNFLHKLSTYGVALIKNTPHSDTALDAIIEKIGFIKRTHYGIKFIVQHVANTSNVAYLSKKLQMHTDLPYYEYCPGVNMLHCMVQTESRGGENLLSDSHFVADFMKKKHPEEYKMLTDTEIEWSDVGVENDHKFFKLHRSPVICVDQHDEISRINFSVPQRGSCFPGPIELVKPWYSAWNLFNQLNHRFSANFKTNAGDILVFDNIRLLHGRNAYEDHSNNVRKLIGAYVDWDEIYSRLRCLRVTIQKDDSLL